MKGQVFRLEDELPAAAAGGAARLLGEYASDGPAMLGVVRIGAQEAQGFWERHDGGDEVLLLLEGRMTFTMQLPDGAESFEVGPGDAVFIPRGVSHTSVLHQDEVRILFVTPREGNVAWNDDPAKPPRH